MTVLVWLKLVPGGVDTVQKIVPVSSSGTRPVLVFMAVKAIAATPTTTAITAMTGRSTNLRTPLVYLFCTAP